MTKCPLNSLNKVFNDWNCHQYWIDRIITFQSLWGSKPVPNHNFNWKHLEEGGEYWKNYKVKNENDEQIHNSWKKYEFSKGNFLGKLLKTSHFHWILLVGLSAGCKRMMAGYEKLHFSWSMITFSRANKHTPSSFYSG